MALEEVRTSLAQSGSQLTVSSKMKLQITSTKLLIPKRVSSPTTRKLKNMAICSSFSNPNLVISPTCVVSFPCRKSTPSSRRSCSPSTVTSTKVVKSIFFSPCSNLSSPTSSIILRNTPRFCARIPQYPA